MSCVRRLSVAGLMITYKWYDRSCRALVASRDVRGCHGNLSVSVKIRGARIIEITIHRESSIASALRDDHGIRLETKVAVCKAALLTALIYGSESWVLHRRHIRKLEQFLSYSSVSKSLPIYVTFYVV